MSSEEQSLKPNAFIIMPFDAEFTAIYNDFIKAGLEEAGYNVTRADSFLDQHNILGGIVKRITTAKLVIAELTTLNANVFYELGLCHGLGIPTVLLAQSIDEVPFDLQGYTVQEYSTRYPEILNLKPLLREIGERHLRGEITFGSPISDFAPPEFQVNHRTAIETHLEPPPVTPTVLESV